MFVKANRRVLGMLDGQYLAIARGRSMDFDDLRAYVAGDEVKDIDWKATARHGSALVRNYTANRQHELVLLVDTGRNMAAAAESGEPKSELAITVAGVLGYLSIRHGDRVSLAHGDETGVQRLPAGGTEGDLERLLRRIQRHTRLDAPFSDLVTLLEDALHAIRRRSIVVVVTDDVGVSPAVEDAVRSLHARHELLWVTVADADLVGATAPGQRLVEVVDAWAVPDFIRGNAALQAEFDAAEAVSADRTREAMERLGISHVRVGSADAVVPALLTMLGRRARARR